MNLPTTETMLSTPYYVLMDGSCRFGPSVLPLHSGIECLSIYGFSSKGSYDKFCLQSHTALTPYPLVKGYLQNQLESPGDSLKLVVVDAARPDESFLRATTMKLVLEAQKKGASYVNSNYRFVFEKGDSAYRVEEDS